MENVSKVVEEIVICVNNENRKTQYSEVLEKYNFANARLLVDDPCNQIAGPIVGILTGLMTIKADYCFTLPSDMPMLKPKIIDYMFNAAKDALVVVPMWPNGRLETLTMVFKMPEILEITKALCMLRRPRSDDIIRGALKILLISTVDEIRTYDPELKSFININSQEDLIKLQPRQAQGSVAGSLHLNLDDPPILEIRLLQKAASLFNEGEFSEAADAFSTSASKLEKENSYFWAGISRENEGKSLLSLLKHQTKRESAIKQKMIGKKALLKAAFNYGCEAEIYENRNCIFLAERARSNKKWCESVVNNLEGQKDLLY